MDKLFITWVNHPDMVRLNTEFPGAALRRGQDDDREIVGMGKAIDGVGLGVASFGTYTVVASRSAKVLVPYIEYSYSVRYRKYTSR